MKPATPFGVRIRGVGSAVPPGTLTNLDLQRMMDTTDEWIVQRTGIHQRRVVDPKVEGTYTLSRDALKRAVDDAGMTAGDLDLIIVATVTGEMTCPSVACRVADALGAAPTPAFDLVAACSGFVYATNLADSLIRSGRYRTIGVVGCDAMSTVLDYTDRTVSILFGDAAGSVILARDDDDPTCGCIYQLQGADGSMWESLYMPRRCQEVPEQDRDNPIRMGCLRMNGREIFKFAVKKFAEIMDDTLQATGLTIDQISQFICHQSNVRIIEAAKERLGLPAEKVYINIDQYGNSSAGSVGLCLDQLWQAGRIKRDDHIMMVAFGGGLTWGSGVWKV